MKERYRTVKKLAEAEIVEKRSRFIATVNPVSEEAEAIAFINELKQKYWNATHNVYAYIIEDNNIMRYSDDGEPSGTAGVPVLDMMKKEGLTNLVVVVTRYFGGVLLGTGGLVHSYSKSAKQGVLAAQIIEMILCKHLTIKCDYTLLGKMQNEISKWDIIQEEIKYTDDVEIPIFIPIENYDHIKSLITELTNAKAIIIDGDVSYKEQFV